MTHKTFIIALLAAALLGCDASIFESKEAQCLRSDSASFKDPTSAKVISNLGNRKFEASTPPESSFWVRYIAKNSFGANVSSNMACKKVASGWVRDGELEQRAFKAVLQREINALFVQVEAFSKAVSECKNKGCADEVKRNFPSMMMTQERLRKETEEKAKSIVLEDAQDIDIR